MSLKISNNSLFTKHYLIVNRDRIKFYDGTGLFGARRFRFEEIQNVLMSADHKLSFQVKQEVFRIQTKPGNAKHLAVIDAILSGVSAGMPQPV